MHCGITKCNKCHLSAQGRSFLDNKEKRLGRIGWHNKTIKNCNEHEI